MTVTERIRKDHEELKTKLNEMLATDPRDSEGRRRLFQEGVVLALTHEAAEERTIYDFVARDRDIRTLALQALEEHKISRMLIDELNHTEVTDETWVPRLVVLNNILVMHMQIEEGNILTLLDNVLDQKQKDDMEKDFEMWKRNTVLVAPERS